MDEISGRVVIVDDDAEIRGLVDDYLTAEGFAVGQARDGAGMREHIVENVPDVVLLDLKLPGEDGLTLARELRQSFPAMGILMISGKEDVVDRVAGLEVGADDYLVKPFHLRELLARIRSVMRRNETDQNGVQNTPEAAVAAPPVNHGEERGNDSPRRIYRFSNWILDCDGRTLVSDAGDAVDLTGGEFDLLIAFASRSNRALSREQLLDYARSGDADAFDRSIDVQVGRLRRKIERNPKRPALIKTVRNVGYMFSADVAVTEN